MYKHKISIWITQGILRSIQYRQLKLTHPISSNHEITQYKNILFLQPKQINLSTDLIDLKTI